ncbi:MAG TPA: SAM-dependent methyltransferase [Kofleriaceae bacterium]|nr:SAM-dependent methyltransferase [Kofleriaceae bacterium]
MRDDTPSRTAQWVAAARGLGRLLPEATRIADDPYGLAFSSSRAAGLVNRSHGERAEALARIPGLARWIVHMQVRTRVIDDAVRAFAAGGGRQVVVLGAGYDCRALRLPELAGARVFEIDHPATQGHKRAVLERLAVTSPVHYLAWDFETRPMDDLPGALGEAGHDARSPTLTIWEGVTMYLTDGAIDASLRAIATWSAPGSELAMTYLGRSPHAPLSIATRVVQAMVQRLGEPFKTTWAPEALPEYLEARGFELVRDVSIRDAARALMPPDLAALVRRDDSHVALARPAALHA